MRNDYPEFPEVAFKPTSVPMPDVVIFAKTLIGKYEKEVVKAAYMIFRIEGGNGLKGVNGNYCGIQADCGRWEGLDLTHVVGTLIKKDNGGALRRFLAFDKNGYQTSFEFLCYKVKQRGIYIGAPGVKNADDIDRVYKTKWNGGAAPTKAEFLSFESLYKSATIAIG